MSQTPGFDIVRTHFPQNIRVSALEQALDRLRLLKALDVVRAGPLARAFFGKSERLRTGLWAHQLGAR